MNNHTFAVLAAGLVPPSSRACCLATSIYTGGTALRVAVCIYRLTVGEYHVRPHYVKHIQRNGVFKSYRQADFCARNIARECGIEFGGTLATVATGRIYSPFAGMPAITF